MLLECVTNITKGKWIKNGRLIEDQAILLESVEIYRYGRGYGGAFRTLEGKNQMISIFPDMVPPEVIIKATFILLAKHQYDPNDLNKLVAYHEKSNLELERLFTWERGKPLEKKVLTF